MGVNVVFVNIDWKTTRHVNEKSARRNMQMLHETIAGIVLRMQPAMLCMCEVGEASNLLTQAHMQHISDTIEEAWQSAAT